ncbi:MAG: M28 family peptidase, partial [Fulvivirga sp.]|nr:M28 family peptidase [Fulvivirga sp.]
RNPAQNARENKADMLFVVNTSTDQEFNGLASQLAHFLSGGSLTLAKPGEGDDANEGVFFIKPSTAGKIFNTTIADLKSAKKDLSNVGTTEITYNLEMNVKEVHTENVLGYMEGSDPELKNELVILTAHYDHVGMDGDEIYNGADDDASGTSTILEIAEAFAEAKKAGKGPRRSILFMPVTAEEKGLLGSAYYAENPIFPLEKTVANLNIDMIGRVDPKHKGNPNYVYLVGTDRLSTELHEISEHVNSTYTNLELDYTYNDEGHPDRIYYRSDHWNFAKNDIPIIFYFNGVHEDYHKPTDTIEKINFDILTKRAHLVFYTAWALANRDERPEVDKLKDQKLDTN